MLEFPHAGQTAYLVGSGAGRACARWPSIAGGFDFALGILGLPRPWAYGIPWAATWALLHQEIIDGEDNSNNRFAVGQRLNQDWAQSGPLGGPAHMDLPDLPPKKTVTYDQGLREWRRFEALDDPVTETEKRISALGLCSLAETGLCRVCWVSIPYGHCPLARPSAYGANHWPFGPLRRRIPPLCLRRFIRPSTTLIIQPRCPASAGHGTGIGGPDLPAGSIAINLRMILIFVGGRLAAVHEMDKALSTA